MQGNKISNRRKELGLTQTDLANAAGVPMRAIQKYENGETKVKNMTLEYAIRLADALSIDPRELLDDNTI